MPRISANEGAEYQNKNKDKVKVKESKDTAISGLKDLLVAVTNCSKNFQLHAFNDLFQATSGTNNSRSANVFSIIRVRSSSPDIHKKILWGKSLKRLSREGRWNSDCNAEYLASQLFL